MSPGTAVTGFPPGTLTGAAHAGDATSAAGDDRSHHGLQRRRRDEPLAPVTVAGNLGGLTLPPGLYKSTSSLSISSGDLTLDAQGDANAVFIFQMASTLTTTSGRAGDPERWRQVFERLLAGGELGDARNDVRIQGHDHGGSVDHAEYRGDAEWQGTGADRRGDAGRECRGRTHPVEIVKTVGEGVAAA